MTEEAKGAEAKAAAQPKGEEAKPSPEDQKGRTDRLKRQSDAELTAEKAKHASEIQALEKKHGSQMEDVKAALNIGGDENADPVKAAEEQTRLATGALKLSQFRVVAATQGVRSDAIDDAFRLIDESSITVDIAAGKVTGVEAAVAKLLETKPYFKAPEDKGSESEKPAVGGGGVNDKKAENVLGPHIMSNPAKIRENAPQILETMKDRYRKKE